MVDSIPLAVIKQLETIAAARQSKVITKEDKYNEHKRKFGLTDEYLDKSLNEPYWLKQDNIASIVADSLHYGNEKLYIVWCYCIMPNHVHLVITTLKDAPPLYVLLQNHKKFTARESNKILKRTGQFWMQERYDHIIRDAEEFNRIVFYTINNPVKAGFVKHWKEWKWTYIHPELEKMFL